MPKLISELAEGDRVSGTVRRCHCGALFIGRADARFCSNACRMREARGGTAPRLPTSPDPLADIAYALVRLRRAFDCWGIPAPDALVMTDEAVYRMRAAISQHSALIVDASFAARPDTIAGFRIKPA